MRYKNTKPLHRLYTKIALVLNSKYMFITVLGLVFLQGLWYAASFQPALFDEQKHFAKVAIHAESTDPFLGEQKPEWDSVGAVSRDGSFMFYFVMGKLLNIISMFTDVNEVQVLFLRLACLTFFILGFIVLRRVFLKVDLKGLTPAVINLTFLFLALTPAVAPLFGALSYDSLAFLCLSLALLVGVNIIQAKKIDGEKILYLAALSTFAVTVKWTNVAFLLPLVAFITYDILKRGNIKKIPIDLIKSFKKRSKYRTFAAIALFACGALLFIERPVVNTLEYGNPEPDCRRVLTEARCEKFFDWKIYSDVLNNKPAGFLPVRPQEYFFTYWAPRMINTQTTLLPWSATTLSPSLPFMSLLYFAFTILGAGMILVYLRDFLKDRAAQMFLFVTTVYCGILFLFLYKLYSQYAIPAAISGRYLLPVMPIFILFAGLAFKRLLSRSKILSLGSLGVVLLLFTQGGGIITAILTTPPRLYWQNETIRTVNKDLKKGLEPLVKE